MMGKITAALLKISTKKKKKCKKLIRKICDDLEGIKCRKVVEKSAEGSKRLDAGTMEEMMRRLERERKDRSVSLEKREEDFLLYQAILSKLFKDKKMVEEGVLALITAENRDNLPNVENELEEKGIDNYELNVKKVEKEKLDRILKKRDDKWT